MKNKYKQYKQYFIDGASIMLASIMVASAMLLFAAPFLAVIFIMWISITLFKGLGVLLGLLIVFALTIFIGWQYNVERIEQEQEQEP